MAGLFTIPRPTTFSSAARPSLTSRLMGFYTLILLISLALLAFALQVPDPITKVDPVAFPGTNLSRPIRLSSSSVDCAGTVLGRNGSGTASFPYYSDRKFGFGSEIRPKVCIASTTSAGLEQILPWIYYHKVIGISNFFLFVEGKAASLDAYKVLKSIPGVKLIRRTRDLEEQQANSRIWNESWLSPFFYKPCNYELFVKQTLNMETSIVMAREADMDWIIHLDTDELIYPAGNHEYSVQKLLSDVPEDVDSVIFPNYESTVERDDIKEPFSEVSMFKKNYDHLPKDTYFSNYREASRGNPNYFLTYGNGKSAARVQDHLRPNGAHRWNNYMKIPMEITFDEAAVLHYTYAKFSDLISRRDRCGCKLTNEDIERCFMLDFDRNAFVIASTGTEEQMLHWYRQYVVWTDKEVNLKLLKQGVLTRIYAPMVITQSLRESGVFSSVIASALDTTSLKELQLSSGSSNTSQDAESISYSRKIGRVSDSRTNARKVLEYSSIASHAIPPQSPPEMHNIHLDR